MVVVVVGWGDGVVLKTRTHLRYWRGKHPKTAPNLVLAAFLNRRHQCGRFDNMFCFICVGSVSRRMVPVHASSSSHGFTKVIKNQACSKRVARDEAIGALFC